MSYDNEVEFGAGFMPGDNETGVVVYPLPQATSARIAKAGAGFLMALGEGWQSWKLTPIAASDFRGTDPGAINYDPDATPLESYLDKYGFSIEVDPEVARRINAAIAEPGSYYQYVSGGGMVIVAPRAGEAYLVYAG